MQSYLLIVAHLAALAFPLRADPSIPGPLQILSNLLGPPCTPRSLVIASDLLGRTMVAWVESGPGSTAIRYAILDSTGGVVTGPLTLSPGPGIPMNLALAASASRFVLVWDTMAVGAPASTGIHFQLFDPSGIIVSGITAANALGPLNERRPDVAAAPGGGFIIGWIRFGPVAGATAGVFVRRFDEAGAPIDPIEIRADDPATNYGWQDGISVGAWSTGGYVAAWQDGAPTAFGGTPSPDGNGSAILHRRWDATMTPSGPAPTTLNSVGAGDQVEPLLRTDLRGGAIFAWKDVQQTSTSIRYQRVTAAAGPAFPIEISLQPYPSNSAYLVSLACDASGGFSIAYLSRGTPPGGNYTGPCGGSSPGYGIPPPPPAGFTRFAAAGGPPLEAVALAAPSTSPFTQLAAAISMDAFGNIVCAQVGGPGGPFDVVARRHGRSQISFAPAQPTVGTTTAITLSTPLFTGDRYLLAVAGTAGPVFFGGRPVRLALDPLFFLSTSATTPQFSGFAGTSSSSITTGPVIAIPNLASLSGITVWVAFATWFSSTAEVGTISDSYPLAIQ